MVGWSVFTGWRGWGCLCALHRDLDMAGLAASWHMGDLGVGKPYVSLGVVAQGGGGVVGSRCRVGVMKLDLKRVFVD
jgi:hypothetical protein